jgi:hypothetical protein
MSDATQVKLLIDVSTIVVTLAGAKFHSGALSPTIVFIYFCPVAAAYQLSRDCAGSIVMKSSGRFSEPRQKNDRSKRANRERKSKDEGRGAELALELVEEVFL